MSVCVYEQYTLYITVYPFLMAKPQHLKLLGWRTSLSGTGGDAFPIMDVGSLGYLLSDPLFFLEPSMPLSWPPSRPYHVLAGMSLKIFFRAWLISFLLVPV